jgi:M6 family metalloprotease-like protein
MRKKLIATFFATLILVFSSFNLPAHGNPAGLSFVNCQISSSKPGWNTLGFPIEKRFNGNLIPTLPRVGKIKAFIIFVDFPNYPGTESVETYSRQFTETTSDYFKWVSYGAIEFDFKFTPEYLRLSRNAESYGIGAWNSGDYRTYYKEGISLATSKYDLAAFDVVYVVASPQTSRAAITPGPAFIDPVRVNGISVARGSATGGMDSQNQRPFRWLAHETGHLFGFIDLYNVKSGVNRLNDVWDNFGYWDIMSMNWETFALEINTWFRLQAGWLAGENAYCNKSETMSVQEVKLSKLSAITGTRASVIRTGEESAIVAEYRTITKYDSLNNNSANEGVLVYEVSGDIPHNEAPVKILRKSGMLVDKALSAAALKVGELIEHKGVVIALIEMNKENATLLIGKNSDLGSIKIRIVELKAAAELKAKQEDEVKIAAELKAKQEAEAKVAAELQAKQEAEAKVAAELKAKQDAEAKVAAELQAKQEAEAKVAADKLAAEKLAAAKLAAMKKTTITCIKGKLIKKVTAVKPKCPTGYKKK